MGLNLYIIEVLKQHVLPLCRCLK